MPTGGELLIKRLDRALTWPLDPKLLAKIALWIAIRENDREYLKRHMNWTPGRDLVIDPLGGKISAAFADLLYSEPPTITPASDKDEQLLDDVLEENQLASELKRGEDTRSSEGSLWWRILADRVVYEHPIVEWHSRTNVVPQWSGRRLSAVAFINGLDPIGDEATVWRHFEIHEIGRVINVLYRGTPSHLGRRVPLSQHPQTDFLEEEWRHGIDGMLAGWVPNRLGTDHRVGVSDYDGIEDFLLALHETASIGQENARLTLKKRVLVPASALDENGELPTDKEALVVEALDSGDTAGQSNTGFKVLEYSFDAAAHIAYSNDLALKALSRVGISAQFIGVPTTDGQAITGVALRLKLIPSTNAANGKAGPMDTNVPVIVTRLQQVDALSYDEGGFGRNWTNPNDAPALERGTVLPEDPVEKVGRLSQATTASIMSRKQAVVEQHPDWEDDQIEEELAEIEKDLKAGRNGEPGTSGGTTPSGLPSIFDRRTPAAEPQEGDGSGEQGQPEA